VDKKGLPRLTEQQCMTIVVVGTLPPGDINEELRAFLADVQAAISTHFPSFVPAQPPITLNVSRLAVPDV
jgi:hypothetical protein